MRTADLLRHELHGAAGGGERDQAAIASAVAGFPPISLEEMDAASLMRRHDRKYVANAAAVIEALPTSSSGYGVLDIEGCRLHPYETVYFDTPDLAFYHAHHADRPVRMKVRSRRYGLSGASFLEVKQRTGTGETVKSRVARPALLRGLTAEDCAALAGLATLPAEPLEAQLLSRFRRVTLVNERRDERVTLDFGVAFEGMDGGRAGLPGMAVIELKRSTQAGPSAFGALLREMRLHPVSFSKYCAGIALLRPAVKQNRFKRQLLMAQRVGEGEV